MSKKQKKMSEELSYELKQVGDLTDSIFRLCNEADSNEIVLNALMLATCRFAEELGLSPLEIGQIFLNFINLRATPKQKAEIRKQVEKSIKQVEDDINRKQLKKKRL